MTSPHDRSVAVVVSSFCAANGCVGVAFDADEVAVLDTKTGDEPALRFTREEWSAFLAGVRNGEFDLPESQPVGDADPG